MRRIILALPLTLLLFMSVSVPVHAASIPLLDPNFHIVPDAHEINSACPVGAPLSYGGILLLIQRLMNAGIMLGIIAFVFVMAYAGASFMMNPTNPEARSHARGMIINVVIGMIILLSSWLVVDFVMKVLYNPDQVLSGGIHLGGWNEILKPDGGDPGCIQEGKTTKILSGVPGAVFDQVVGPSSESPTPITPSTRGLCTPANLEKNGWPSNLSKQMSCVTKYENGSCNASAPSSTDVGKDGNSVSIGLFQVNLSAHDMNYPACKAFNGGKPLNCTKAFAGGKYTSTNHNTYVSDPRLYQQCRAAASNPACNIAAAIEIRQNEGIGAWGTAAQNNCKSL
ncbi:MAG: pilin [Bacillota bacterium]